MDVSRFVIEGYDKNAVYQVMSFLAVDCFACNPTSSGNSDATYSLKINALLDRENRLKTGRQTGDSYGYEGPNILNWRSPNITGGY